MFNPCLPHAHRLVKIRLQDKSSSYAGPFDVIKTIVRQEGLKGMYQGMESTFWRCARCPGILSSWLVSVCLSWLTCITLAHLQTRLLE